MSRRSRRKSDTDSIHSVWKTMHALCSDTKHSRYHRYGGRGISVCEEWEDLENFSKWASRSGYRKGLQIERIDSDGHYGPDNCRWSDPKDQNRNRADNRLVTYGGVTKTLSEWADDPRCAVTYRTLLERIRGGQSFERSLSAPHGRRNGYRVIEAFGEERPVTEWANDPRCPGVHASTLWKRVNEGWLPETAITTPTRVR